MKNKSKYLKDSLFFYLFFVSLVYLSFFVRSNDVEIMDKLTIFRKKIEAL